MVAELIHKEIEHRKGAISSNKLFRDLRVLNKVIYIYIYIHNY